MFSVFILLNLIVSATSGQEAVNNFQTDNKEIIWVRVFADSAISFDKLIGRVKESGLLNNIDVTDNKITGDTKEFDTDFKSAGYSEMSTPMYIARSRINGFLIIEFKDKKYRVVLKKITLTQKYSDPLTMQGGKTSLETFGLKRGKNEFTGVFKKSPSLILNNTFSSKFEFKESKAKKDW